MWINICNHNTHGELCHNDWVGWDGLWGNSAGGKGTGGGECSWQFTCSPMTPHAYGNNGVDFPFFVQGHVNDEGVHDPPAPDGHKCCRATIHTPVQEPGSDVVTHYYSPNPTGISTLDYGGCVGVPMKQDYVDVDGNQNWLTVLGCVPENTFVYDDWNEDSGGCETPGCPGFDFDAEWEGLYP